MKRIFTLLSITVLALAGLAACGKAEGESAIEGNKATIKFVADADVAIARTELDATGKKAQWVDGDRVAMPYYNTEKSSWSLTSNPVVLADGKASFEFSVYGASSTKDNTIFFIYPCRQNGNYVNDGVFAPLNVAATQTPTLTSFDGAADVLVGKPVSLPYTGTWSKPMEVEAKFIRKAGFLRIHFAGIGASLAEQEVKTVTVAAQEGAKLAGENLGVKTDIAVDAETADPYSIIEVKGVFDNLNDSSTTNTLVADYSAKNITIADLQTTAAGEGVWLGALPAEISSLTVTIETKSGSKVLFAERATAGMAVKENEITPITLTFDAAKGDKATATILVNRVLTITNTADGLAAAVTDEEGNAVEMDAVSEYGLTTSLSTGTYFWFSSSSSSAYIRNTKAIGDYITKLTVKGSSSSDGYRLNTNTTAITSTSGTNSTGTTTKTFTADNGIKYFNVSKHSSKTGKVTSIVIEYTVKQEI